MAWSTYTYNSLIRYCGNCSIVLSGKIPIMIENKNVITRSLIVLFLSLSMVYSLTYMKKATLFKAADRRWNEIVNQTWNQNIWSIADTTNSSNNKASDSSKNNSTNSVSLGWSGKSSWVTNSNTQAPSKSESNDSASLAATNPKMLSGTTEYYGVLDIVSILGQKPEFTLQDSKWNYFVYYGNHLDFVATIVALGWNVYEMVTETEILQNQLFGDRVSYINLSMFKDVRVMMVIEIDGDVWLLQIPSTKYHQSKDYLKSLFIQ